jgi:phospholipid transport system substrate-binding protein
MLAPVIDPVFDLDAILRSSVGLSWSSLPPDQQDQLRSAFCRYTTASYVNSFDHFDGQCFTVEPLLRPAGNGEQIVVPRITPRSGDSHEIDCVIRNTPSG